MGIVKVTNKVFGISTRNMIVPGGPVEEKTTDCDLAGLEKAKCGRSIDL